MPKVFFEKLKKGMAKVLQDNPNRLPPIVVRRHKTEKGHYEIIDGFHRWKALSELKQPKINVFVIKADDKIARVLTNTLNYLRGQPDREKYAKGLVDLIGMGFKTADLADLLPDSENDIDDFLEEAEISIEAFQSIQEENAEIDKENEAKDGSGDIWVELKFKVTSDQARVVEQEIARIASGLRGKNLRGRALEYMAANSSISPLPGDLS